MTTFPVIASLRPFIPTLAVVIGMVCGGASRSAAAEPAAVSARTISIAPCSASLAGGKAKLTRTGLQRKAGTYVGDYQISVVPYFFKSESGTLAIAISDDSLRKLAGGSTVNLAGKAMTKGTGKTRPVKVKATPAGVGASQGSVTISIKTENGDLVFASDYTLGGT